MTAYFNGKEITSHIPHIEYPENGIPLHKFVKTVYGNLVLKMIKNGVLVLSFNIFPIKFDENFRNYHVHEDTRINVSDAIDVSEDELFRQLIEILMHYKFADPENWQAFIKEIIENIKTHEMLA